MNDFKQTSSLQTNVLLQTLFGEWETVERDYRKAVDASDAAQASYRAAIYHAPKRTKEALKAVHIWQTVEKLAAHHFGDLSPSENRNGKPFEPRQNALIDCLREYMEPGEEPDSFMQYCIGEAEKEERSKQEAKRRYRLDDLERAVSSLVNEQREIGERMAEIEADSMIGVGFKIQVAQGIDVTSLNNSIMSDIRRFAEMPPPPDGLETPMQWGL